MNPKAFKALKAKWDKKLAKSGFKDLEDKNGDLIFFSSRLDIKRWHPTQWAAKEDYYRLAGQFLYEHKFEDVIQKDIWELHAEGLTLRDIAEELKRRKIKTNKDIVNKVVNTLAAKMRELYKL